MEIKQSYRVLGIAAPLCLAWALAPAALAKNTLQFTIVDETGKPLVKQEIVLTVTGGDKEWKRKTNDEGKVEFKGLDDGSYQVRGAIPEYVTSKSAPIELSGNATKLHTHKIASVNFANKLFQEVQQLLTQKKFAEAEEGAKKAVELLPNESGSYYLLSVAYAYQGREAETVEAIKKAAELDPGKYSSKISVVQLAALDVQAKQAEAKKDLDGMVKKYEQMLTVAEDKATVYYNMALAYGRVNNYDQALKTIDKAIELKPEDAELQQMKLRLQDLYLKAMDKKLER